MTEIVCQNDLTYLELDNDTARPARKPIIPEAACTLYVNGQRWVTLLCTPSDLDALALGFLCTEGLIRSLDDVADYVVRERGEVGVEIRLKRQDVVLPQRLRLTSGCAGGVTFYDLVAAHHRLNTGLHLVPAQVYDGMARLLAQHADLYHEMGGFHMSALGDGEDLLLSAYDVGRHNTLDKIAGLSLLRGIPTKGRFLLTTGRVSTEMLSKAASMGVPLVASRNSPTYTAVRLAREWGMTLCGYVRGRRMHIYSAPERLGFGAEGTPFALSISRCDATAMWSSSERAMPPARQSDSLQ